MKRESARDRRPNGLLHDLMLTPPEAGSRLYHRLALVVAMCVIALALGCRDELPTQATALAESGEAGGDGDSPSPSSATNPPDAPDVIAFSLGPGPSGQAGLPLATVYRAATSDLLTYSAKATGILYGSWTVATTGWISPLPPGGARNRDGSCAGFLVRASGNALNGTGAGFPCGDEADTVASNVSIAFKDSLRFGRAAGGNPGPIWVDGQQVCGGYDCLVYSGQQDVRLERLKGEIDGEIHRYGTTSPASVARWGQQVTAKSWITYAGNPVNWLSYGS